MTCDSNNAESPNQNTHTHTLFFALSPQRDRRGDDRVARHVAALLRDAQGAPRTAGPVSSVRTAWVGPHGAVRMGLSR